MEKPHPDNVSFSERVEQMMEKSNKPKFKYEAHHELVELIMPS